ncbi:MAG: hypothetical protein WAW37_10010 [Syntrophobacteraceae bacterium]
MNCPKHINEKNDPEVLKKKKEQEELEEVEVLYTGVFVGEDYRS